MARTGQRVGGSVRDAQFQAGHKHLETTQRYIDGDDEARQKVVQLIRARICSPYQCRRALMIDLDKLRVIKQRILMDDGGHFNVQIKFPSVAITGFLFVGTPIGFTTELEGKKRRIEGVVDGIQHLVGDVVSIGVKI